MLRNDNLFDIPYVRLESQKNFPISSFPRLWNEIIIPNTEQNDDNVEQNLLLGRSCQESSLLHN